MIWYIEELLFCVAVLNIAQQIKYAKNCIKNNQVSHFTLNGGQITIDSMWIMLLKIENLNILMANNSTRSMNYWDLVADKINIDNIDWLSIIIVYIIYLFSIDMWYDSYDSL